MILPSIKELKELLKVLRANGVTNYNSTDLQLVLSENFTPPTSTKSKAEEIMTSEDVEEMTQEELDRLINYSSMSPLDPVSE
jgi:hypothetical protein